MKRLSLLVATVGLAALAMTGCTKVEQIDMTDIAVKVDGSTNQWESNIYSGETLNFNTFCRTACSDAHIFEGHHAILTIKSDYAMPKSNDMDLTLGLSLKVTLNKDGSPADIQKRLKSASSKYKYTVTGQAKGENQIFKTALKSIYMIDLSEAQVKGMVRPVLEPFTLSDAFYNVSKSGSIITDVEQKIREHLVAINSPLKLLSIEVETIAQPESIKEKRQAEENLNSSERLHARKLDMREKRMKREQLIRVQQAMNDLEILELNAEFMTAPVLAYKWIETAQMFAENGIPLAIDPTMLNPSIDKNTNMSVNTSKARAKLKERIAELEAEIQDEEAETMGSDLQE